MASYKFDRILLLCLCFFVCCAASLGATDETYGARFAMNNFGVSSENVRRDEDVADRIYENTMSKIRSEFGDQDIVFPKVVVFLNGAPGAGKGTNTLTVMQILGISNKPVEVSSLLITPECEMLKSDGKLIDDDIVIMQVVHELLKPENSSGIIIDGFPRSPVQAYFLKRLVSEFGRGDDIDASKFVMVTFSVTKQTSIDRQIARGAKALEDNEIARKFGSPEVKVRATDINPDAAAARYDTYEEYADECRSILDGHITHYEISAEGTREEVTDRIHSTFEK